jgi:hypothetical protein
MQDCSQAVDIRLRGGKPAILLWRCIPDRSIGHAISLPSRVEETCKAKVNQENLPGRGTHDICRFEVAKENGWLMTMQILQNIAELHAYFKGLFEGKTPPRKPFQVLFKALSFDEVHDEIAASRFIEVIMHVGQMRMREVSENIGFLLKSLDDLRRKSRGVHLFVGNQPVFAQVVFRFVNDSHPSLANPCKNPIASLQQAIEHNHFGFPFPGLAHPGRAPVPSLLPHLTVHHPFWW